MRRFLMCTVLLFAGCEKDSDAERGIVMAVCDDSAINACYAKYGEPGSREGLLTAWVDHEGRVVRAAFRGRAYEAVAECLVDRAKELRDSQFKGRAGRVECSWSGTFEDGRLVGWRKRRYLVE